tara:strand:- start:59 stop:556 length:498 start_codon:yes stop_codon:yes gene_type:complete
MENGVPEETARTMALYAVGLGPAYMASKMVRGALDVVGLAQDAYGAMTGDPNLVHKAYHGQAPIVNYSDVARSTINRSIEAPNTNAPVISSMGTGFKNDPKRGYFNVDMGANPRTIPDEIMPPTLPPPNPFYELRKQEELKKEREKRESIGLLSLPIKNTLQGLL